MVTYRLTRPNNVNIPQNDIPLLSAKMEAMPLLAKARRIAIGKILKTTTTKHDSLFRYNHRTAE